MTDIKIGALCWNQYTDWPRLLQAGIRADELGYDTLWTWDHLYPIVGDSHGPELRGLADDHRLGAGDEAGPDRPDGRRQHVPRARRSRPRWRRRSTTSATAARSWASAGPGSRRSTRTSGSSSGPGSRSGCAGWARRCRSCAACSTGRSPRPRGPHYTAAGHAQPAGARPGAPADLHRRRRREGHPQAGREVRRHEQHRRRRSRTCARKEEILLQHCEAVGRDPAEIERTTGDRDGLHPRRPRPRPSGCSTRRSTATASRSHWEDQPVGTPEDVAEKLAPVRRRSATGT